MSPPVRSRSTFPLCSCAVLLLSGCLPDPPAYDACVDGESNYYSVAPKGCNGHELVTLYAQESASDAHAVNLDGPFYRANASIALDAESVYWADSYGRVLQTPKRGGSTVPLLPPLSSGFMSVLGLDLDKSRLYVGASLSTPGMPQAYSQIIGIDIPSGEARTLVELTDVTMSRVMIDGDRFYFTVDVTNFTRPYSTSNILTGTLDWSSTTNAGGVSVLVPKQVSQFTIVEHRLYYIDADALSLQAMNLADGMTVEVLTLDPSSGSTWSLQGMNGHVYLFDCDTLQTDCRWSRIDTTGNVQVVADGLSAYPTTIAADAEATYVIGSLASNPTSPPRLLVWTEGTEPPTTIAAPFRMSYMSTRLQMDADYLYISEFSSESTEGTLESSTPREANRLLRVHR